MNNLNFEFQLTMNNLYKIKNDFIRKYCSDFEDLTKDIECSFDYYVDYENEIFMNIKYKNYYLAISITLNEASSIFYNDVQDKLYIK